MVSSSQSNASLCELCHIAPSDIYTRNQMARETGFKYVRARTNRTKVDVYMANTCGYPLLVGMRVCGTCYHRISFIVNNAQHLPIECAAHAMAIESLLTHNSPINRHSL